MGAIERFRSLSRAGKVAIILVLLGAVGVVAKPGIPAAPANITNTAVAEPAEVKAASITTETTTATEAIPFQKKTQQDSNLAIGTTNVTVAGMNGVKTLTYKVTRTDGVETSRELTKAEVTTAPIDEMTNIGTYIAPAPKPKPAPAPRPRPAASNCDPNYSPCIPNVSYDLDCGDIGMTVRVIGSDVHRLDRDKDGYGCE